MQKYLVSNIKWDMESDGEVLDPDDFDLPDEMEVYAEDEDDALEVVSDECEWCVLSSTVEKINE